MGSKVGQINDVFFTVKFTVKFMGEALSGTLNCIVIGNRCEEDVLFPDLPLHPFLKVPDPDRFEKGPFFAS